MAAPASRGPLPATSTTRARTIDRSGVADRARAGDLDRARAEGLRPLARIRAVGSGGCHPSVMGLSPVPAVRVRASVRA